MLLNYNARNFGSFKDSFEFSMKPIKFMKRFEDNIVSIDNKINLSRFAVIAGENAGGKTSLIRSLDYLRFCILESNHMSMFDILSHMHDTKNSQSFELMIIADKKIYTYRLEIDRHTTVYESLDFRYLNQRPSSDKNIFKIQRSETAFDLDDKDTITDMNLSDENIDLDIEIHKIPITFELFLNSEFIPKEISNVIMNSKGTNTGSFVNYLYKLNIDIIRPFIEWIENRLIIELPTNASLNVYKSMENNSSDLKIMQTPEFLEIIQLLDSSISEVNLSKSDVYAKTIITRLLKNGTKFEIKLEEESSGMQAFFAWAVQLWKVVYRNAVLFADEIDSVLNPVLSSRIITFLRGNEHGGQFIFSTHNVMNLNTNDFMKEQIYFVSKNLENLSSELYSLKDFKDYRYEKANVYELYMKGILGGVPNS